MRAPLAALAVAVLLAGCSAAPGEPVATPAAPPATDPATAEVFPAGALVDYQLGGGYEPPAGVTVVTRDSTDVPAEGLYSICYVNGFQTQPGEQWPDDLVVLGPDGSRLVDPNWPDENVIDISTEQKRADAAERRYAVIDSCAGAGFDAVEFDNLDSFTRSGDTLTVEDAVAFATLLVQHAHSVGLAAGQKNTVELASRGRDEIGFDFAVLEECDQYEECSLVTDVYGDAVIDIEYTDELRRPFEEVCADALTPASTILRDRDLTTPGSPDYAYETC